MRTFLCLFTALFLFTSQAALADKIYRWTDANGQTHFGSQPPESVNQSEEVILRTQRPSANTDVTTNNNTASTANGSVNNNKETPEEAAVVPSIDPELAARNCRIAKEQKQNLSENFNRRFQQSDGNFRPLTDAERATKTKQMEELIKQYCY